MESRDQARVSRDVQQRDLWQKYYSHGFDVGTWFFLSDEETRFGPVANRQKSRPWIVARKQPLEFGVLAFARSRSTMNGLWHPAHGHTSPSCSVRRDAWIKIYDPRTLPSDLLGAAAYSCDEPDPIIVRLVAAVPDPEPFAGEAV